MDKKKQRTKKEIVGSAAGTTGSKQEQDALRESEERYRSILEQMDDAYYEVDLAGNFTFLNESHCRKLGYSREELMGKSYGLTVPEDDIKKLFAASKAVFKSGEPDKCFSHSILRKDGSILFAESFIGLRRNKQGAIIGFRTVSRDVTDRKQAERALEIQRNLGIKLSQADDLIQALQLCLEAAIEVSGMDSGGIYIVNPDTGSLDLIHSSGVSKEFIKRSSHYAKSSANTSLIMSGKPVYADYSQISLSISKEPKSEGLKALAVVPVSSSNRVVACLNIGSHTVEEIPLGSRNALETIASQIGGAIERMQTLEVLSGSEERYRLLADNVHDIIWTTDMNFRTTYVSPSVESVLGFKPEERMQQDITEQLTPSSLSIAMNTLARELATEQTGQSNLNRPIVVETEYYHKDGSILCFENSVTGIRNDQGILTGLLGVARSIAERKQAEDLLKQIRQNYEAFFNGIDDFLFVLDEKGNIIHTNTTVINRLGYTEEELSGESVLTVHPPERREEAGRIVGEMLAGTATFCPVPVVTKSGRQIPVETRVRSGSWDGKPVIFGVSKDISQIKLSEEKFSKIFQSSSALISLNNIESGRFVDVNDAFLNTLGFSRDEVIGKTPEALKVYAEADKQNEIIETLTLNGTVNNIEVVTCTKDGSLRDGLASAETIYIGKDLCLLTVLVDITERKRAEAEIESARDQYQSLVNNIPGIVYRCKLDKDWTMLYMSDAVDPLSGYPSSDFIQNAVRTYESVIHPDDTDYVAQSVNTAVAEERSWDIEYRICHKDGDIRWVHEKGRGVPGEDGGVAYLDGFILDITERRQVEDTLKESEAQYHLLSEHTIDTVWLMDMNLKITYHSPSVEKMRGFTAQEIIEMPIEQHVTPESFKLVSEVLLKELPRVEAEPDYNPVLTLELEYYRKDGTTIWTENKFSIIRDENCRPVSILGEARDVSERRQGEAILRESEERYRSILDQMYDHYYEVDLAGNFTFVNESTCRSVGYTLEELIGKSYRITVPEDDIKRIFTATKDVFKSGEPNKCFSHGILCKDGSIIFAESFIGIRRNKQGEIIGFRTVSRDVGERKQAEAALNKTEGRYRELMTNLDAGVVVHAPDTSIIMNNARASELLGLSDDQMKGKLAIDPQWKFIYESTAPLPIKEYPVNQIAVSKKPLKNQTLGVFRLLTNDIAWLTVNGFPILDSKGEISEISISFIDITERKRAEDALKESEKRFDLALEGTGAGVWDWDMVKNQVVYSIQWKRMLGYDDHEIENSFSGWKNLWHQDDCADIEKSMQDYLEGKTSHYEIIHRLRHKDGGWRWILTRGEIQKDAQGKPCRWVGTNIDITGQRLAEEALKDSEEKYRVVVENALEAVVIAVDGMIKFSNHSGEILTGYAQEELTSRPFTEFIHPDDREIVTDRHLRRMKGEDIPNIYSFRIIDKAGNIKWVELSAALINWEGRTATLNFLTDITDRKRLEEERQRVDKLESVGVLAGGIAHDFNNILTSILGNISLAGMEATPGSELQNRLEQAEKASLRAKDLTVQLLTFAKGGAPVMKLASLTELLKEAAGFALTGSKVKCRFSIPAGLWHAEIDAGQVSQVIHNLVINARQAMPSAGTIEITAENIALNETQSLGRGLPVIAGNYVRIAVADHGTGIPGENMEKIFDPFFSTKKKGSGLGLATSFSIARQHGGHISVESKVGSGSTFYLYLPASTQTATAKQDKKEALKAVGKARILVMDDEPGVRDVAVRMLKHIGYEDVEFAEHGAEAIKLYKAAMESGKPFCLAILDLTIAGGMGGEVVIQKLLKIDPGVKAIVSSGYIDDSVIAKFREYGFSGMVAKPYTIAELRKAVQDVIGGA